MVFLAPMLLAAIFLFSFCALFSFSFYVRTFVAHHLVIWNSCEQASKRVNEWTSERASEREGERVRDDDRVRVAPNCLVYLWLNGLAFSDYARTYVATYCRIEGGYLSIWRYLYMYAYVQMQRYTHTYMWKCSAYTYELLLLLFLLLHVCSCV